MATVTVTSDEGEVLLVLKTSDRIKSWPLTDQQLVGTVKDALKYFWEVRVEKEAKWHD